MVSYFDSLIDSHQRTEQILRYLEIDPEKDNTNWAELRDNRDFNVVQNWAPPERAFNEDLQDESFQEEVNEQFTIKNWQCIIGIDVPYQMDPFLINLILFSVCLAADT